MKPHCFRGAAFPAMLSVFLVSCTPWTVRPIGQSGAESGQSRPFDADRYVDSIWNAKVLPAISGGAVELADLLRPASHWTSAVLVKGEGRVLRVDISSRTGLLTIDAEPYDGRPDAAVQIGPVIRGTTLRDALPFIQFSQFVNQLQFAQVGNALNGRVSAALASFPNRDLAGSIVVFSGAAAPPSEGGLLEIVPVTLAVKRGRP
jgi:predicted lipoprotein